MEHSQIKYGGLTTGSDRRAFTVTELLVVIAIIAVVVGLVFVAFPKITGGARASKCMANQRGIAMASMTYASDNKTRLVSPRTDSNAQQVSSSGSCSDWAPPIPQANSYRHYWVAAFNDTSSGMPNHGSNIVDGLETAAALKNGALWNYTGNVDSYRSPFDPTPRLRSYSLNGFVGVRVHDERCLPQIPAQFRHDTSTITRIVQPAKTLYSVAEWDRFDIANGNNFNFNGFIVHPDVNSRYWFDLPALWHEDVTISYADGSTGAIPIKNKALLNADEDGHDFTEPNPALDFHEFRRMMLPGLIN